MTRRYKVVGAPNGVWLVVTDDPAERFVAWFSSRDEADAEASRLNHSSQGKTRQLPLPEGRGLSLEATTRDARTIMADPETLPMLAGVATRLPGYVPFDPEDFCAG